MRRGLSILLVFLFGLGPLAATLEASDESLLPACCRRHGDHHCAMSARALAQADPSPAFSASSRCPRFPGYTAANTTPGHALAAGAVSLPVLLAHSHALAAAPPSAQLRRFRIHAVRGPPSLPLA